MENVLSKLGSARDASLEDREFTLIPHRTDDSQDSEEVWVWKLQEWVDGHIVDSRLIG